MTRSVINVGAQNNDPNSDVIRTAFQKCNANFAELYNNFGTVKSVLDFNVDNSGATDCYLGLAAARTWLLSTAAAGQIPTLIFPAGIYKCSQFPNFAVQFASVISAGEVRLRFTGTGDFITLNGNAADVEAVPGVGISQLTFGPFIVECPTTAGDAVVVQACHHSKIYLNVKGAGATSAGLRTRFCVVTEFPSYVCSVNEEGWYLGATPQIGLAIDKRTSDNAPTSYCLFTNPIIEGPQTGIRHLSSLGALSIGGTSEGCSVRGVLIDAGVVTSRFIGMDCEANAGQDFICSGVGCEIISCDTNELVTFASGATACVLQGGLHKSVTIAAGAVSNRIGPLTFNRANNGGVITDGGTTTFKRDLFNYGAGAMLAGFTIQVA